MVLHSSPVPAHSSVSVSAFEFVAASAVAQTSLFEALSVIVD